MNRMSNELLARVAEALKKSYVPSGDEAEMETAERQLDNEKTLENLYRDCKTTFGIANAVTIEVFLRLFDVLIGLYRLDRCETLLNEVIPAIDTLEANSADGTASSSLTSKYKLKAVQCSAFTKWKQGKLSEAMDLFIQMEDMMKDSPPSPALLENMGHTYSSMGNLDAAKMYFKKAITAGSMNQGGLLLGLGLISERSGDLQGGLKQCLEALEWYESKFTGNNNESSLEAKCSLSVAKIYARLKDQTNALKYATRAVNNFRRTCGSDSPLLASALKVHGEILAKDSDQTKLAISTLQEALNIETKKDAVDMVTMMELIHGLTKIIQNMPDSTERRVQFRSIFKTAMRGCESVREKLSHDGNVGAFLKFTAELGIYAEELNSARSLIQEALPLFQAEKSVDCTGIVEQCEQILSLLDQRIVAK